jgi:hypothetical protein
VEVLVLLVLKEQIQAQGPQSWLGQSLPPVQTLAQQEWVQVTQ